MGLTASLQGHRVTSARITMPAWGCWYADVSIDGEHEISGSSTLAAADLSLQCTVLSGGVQKGRSSYRLVAGRGGWGRAIPAKSYANDVGVKWSTVLGDAASAVGESLDLTTVPSERTGPAFVRPEGPASRVLELLSPSSWHVGEDGVTRIGRRAARPLTAAVPRVSDVDKARATVTLAPTSLAAIVPGITVDGIEAVDVLHVITADGIRTTLWGAGGSGTARRTAAWRVLFDQMDPNRLFRGITEYRVVTQEGERLNLQPVRVSTGMPSLQRVPIRHGVAGCRSDVMPGTRVLVAFVDSDPGRPVAVGFEDAEGEGFTPLLTEIDAATLVRLGAGAKPAIAAGDLAGGIWPCVPTQVKVLV